MAREDEYRALYRQIAEEFHKIGAVGKLGDQTARFHADGDGYGKYYLWVLPKSPDGRIHYEWITRVSRGKYLDVALHFELQNRHTSLSELGKAIPCQKEIGNQIGYEVELRSFGGSAELVAGVPYGGTFPDLSVAPEAAKVMSLLIQTTYPLIGNLLSGDASARMTGPPVRPTDPPIAPIRIVPDPEVDDIIARIAELGKRLPCMASEIGNAYSMIAGQPEPALITARKILERLSRRMYRGVTGLDPRRLTLYDLSEELKRYLPEIIMYKMHSVRLLGNIAAHDDSLAVTREDAQMAVLSILQIAEWVESDMDDLPL